MLEIEVSEGMSKPYYCKSKGREKGSYICLGRSTLEVIEELQLLIRIKKNLADPELIEGENYIKCILPRVEKQKIPESNDEMILDLFNRYAESTLDQIQEVLTVSRTTAIRCVNSLISQRKVIRIGKTRATRFRRI